MINRIVSISFAIGIFGVIVAGLLKIQHWPWANEITIISWIIYYVFVVAAILELYGSEHVKSRKRIIWMILLLVPIYLAGVVYMLAVRKKMLYPKSPNIHFDFDQKDIDR